MLKVHLVCIDAQNDFTDPNGSLYVKGGDENVGRTPPTWEWYRPAAAEIKKLDSVAREHVIKGGLLIRRIEGSRVICLAARQLEACEKVATDLGVQS